MDIIGHAFEAFDGASGMTCTKLVTDGLGFGDQCGQPASKHRPESASKPVRLAANGLTLEFDLPTLLGALDHQPEYDMVDEEWVPSPTSFRDAITSAAARMLVDDMRKAVKETVHTAVRDAVVAEVGSIVRDAVVNGTLQRTNEWGQKQGEAKTLAQIILETANELLTKPTGDSYASRRPTVIQKIISDEVTTAFRNDLKAEAEKARKAAQQAVQNAAAQVMKETIERAARGL